MPVSPPVIKTTWVFIEFLLETFHRPIPNPNLRARICGHELPSTTEDTKPCRLSARAGKKQTAGRSIRGNAYHATLCFGLEPTPRSISHSLTVAPITSG